ncbi:MAG: ribonuclease P protein component [Ekhidna sp.]|uniref:ribonuclease P protein component n=1 Tax=Ekhidna sp. TaxID=2608089 RepID=UPI0032EEBD74
MGLSKYSFSKKERLSGKKKIEGLFKTGSSFYLDNFQVRHMPTDDSGPHQVLISVPKKIFKRAVDRNLLKRRIREAYRLNKHLITDISESTPLYIGFIYLSKQILTFHEIEAQLIKCLERLGTSYK